jgi:hypothetical protein
MTGQEALKLIDSLLQASKQQGVNDLQSAILLAAWERQSYQVLADRLDYEVDYIKQTAAHLWKQIARIIGEDVSKSNIQSVLRRYQETHEIPVYNKMQDWGGAIDVDRFYDRQTELQTLEAWTIKNRCRFIGIFGLGGMGKTALSIKLAQTVQERFEYIIWRSLRQAPLLKELLEDIVPKLTSIKIDEVAIATLMEQLRQKRCLLVLDNVESILQSGDLSGQYRVGYEDYCQLFEYICDEPHQSCLILTGREKPEGIAVREGTELPVRSLQIQGLSVAPAQKILTDKGLIATTGQYQALVNYFGGNPLVLKIAATTIQSLSGGDVRAFLAQGSTVFSSLCDLLEEQFQRLSTLQQQVMYWFAINREGINPVNLQAKLLPKLPLQRLLEILEALQERSLIEITETGLSQQPVIMEYVTEHFIQTVEREIIEGKLNLFRTHTLLEAPATKYLRGAQVQLILYPLTERLLAHFGSKSQLEQHLGNILDGLRGLTPAQTGYGGGNLLNLFCYLKTDLKGFDFSSLAIRQAYPLNTVLPNTDCTNAQISQTILAETIGGIVSIAFSHDGRHLAISDIRGDIQIWDAQTRTQLVRCHGDQHWTLAVTFSPNGQYLASVSDDCRVKLWEVETGQCLCTYEGYTNKTYAYSKRLM